RRSGRFNPQARYELAQQDAHRYEDVNLELWKEKGIEAVVVGSIEEQPDGRLKVSYDLVDVFQKQQEIRNGELVNVDRNRLDSYAAFVQPKDLRFHSHRIADRVYEKLTGERGAFATRIAYVSVDRTQAKPFRLMVADSDGHAPQTLFTSTESIMSPAWSPDAQKLAYVSFENGRSEVYIQNLYVAGKRQRVAAFEGINSAPSFSPDGRRLALTLSRDGNAEIYILDLTSYRFSRITHTQSSIETEASWTPDGQSLLYTSDRGRGPQIYKQNLASTRAQRVTWEGNYNASASLTPDGKTMVLINRTNGIFHVAVQDVETNSMQTLTKTSLDESPSLAPNGSMVIYATVYQNRQVLSVVSTDGRFKARLPSKQGEVKAPVWSPYLN
ncbi:MAG: Tol-Pal system beta propeller repeat protein TolB, partial [Kangiellaceae bacterium]|nr:Tol-Pal system beta propeller repeat protein TolB [Kangiellaceae bacterium]